MFSVDIPISTLQELLDEVHSAGGSAMRFTVYDASDEIPDSITTCGLIPPDLELNTGSLSVFPADHLL